MTLPPRTDPGGEAGLGAIVLTDQLERGFRRLIVEQRSVVVLHDAQFDAILEQLEAAGVVEVHTDKDGQQAIRLTPEGERVTRQLAMTDEGGQDTLLAALLGE